MKLAGEENEAFKAGIIASEGACDYRSEENRNVPRDR